MERDFVKGSLLLKKNFVRGRGNEKTIDMTIGLLMTQKEKYSTSPVPEIKKFHPKVKPQLQTC